MIFQKLQNFCNSHKKTVFFLVFFLGIFALTTQWIFAADGAPEAQSAISQEDGEKIIGYLNMALKAAATILGLITSFVSIFLYPGWVNGTMFWLQDYLKLIWVLVSNVIYFIFAGILIVIAFMNIIGKGDGTWELKQALPKFIVGVLIVPFSWFFVQFLLSLSAILTVGVLTLPYESFQNEELFGAAMEESEVTNQKFCKDIIISITGNFDGVEGGTSSLTEWEDALQENIRCKGEGDSGKVSIKDIISGEGGGEGIDNNVFGIISVYTYGILRVQELDTIAALDLTTVKWISDLIFKVIFDLLFVVVYLILMVALFLALLVRGVRLWVYMMLSPAFGLLYFLGKGSEGFWSSDDGSKFSISEFIALAMVPVYASAALAFGLVFILVATEGIKEASSEDDLDTLKAGWFSISIIGAHADGEEEKSVIAKLIVELFWVAVLWIAVMAALWASDTTKTVTAPIKQFGTSVWKMVTAAPTYMPILPASLGGSAAGLGQMGSTIQSGLANAATTRWWEAAKRFLPWSSAANVDQTTNAQRAISTLQASGVNNANSLSALQNTIKWGTVETMRNNQETVDMLQKYLDEARKIDATVPDITVTQNSDSIAKAIGALDEYYNRTGKELIWGSPLNASSNPTAVNAALAGTSTPPADTETPPVAGATNNITINATDVNKAGISFSWTGASMTATGIEQVKTALWTLTEAEKQTALDSHFTVDQVTAILNAIR